MGIVNMHIYLNIASPLDLDTAKILGCFPKDLIIYPARSKSRLVRTMMVVKSMRFLIFSQLQDFLYKEEGNFKRLDLKMMRKYLQCLERMGTVRKILISSISKTCRRN